jgi:chromosome segregation ATPase
MSGNNNNDVFKEINVIINLINAIDSKEYNTKNENTKKISDGVTNIKKKVELIDSLIDKLLSKIVSTENNLKDNDNATQVKLAEMNSLRSQIESIKQQNNELQQKSENDGQSTSARIQQLQQEAQERIQSMNETVTENNELKSKLTELENLKNENDTNKKTIETLNETIQSSGVISEQKTAQRISEIEQKYEDQIKGLTENIEKIQKERNEHESNHNAKVDELNRNNSEITDLQNKLTAAHNDVLRLSQSSEQLKEKLSGYVITLKRFLEKYKKLVDTTGDTELLNQLSDIDNKLDGIIKKLNNNNDNDNDITPFVNVDSDSDSDENPKRKLRGERVTAAVNKIEEKKGGFLVNIKPRSRKRSKTSTRKSSSSSSSKTSSSRRRRRGKRGLSSKK